MKSVLVVYGTTEGQAGRVAAFIADGLRAHGAKADLVDSSGDAAEQIQPVYTAAIVCGSLHGDRFKASLQRFVKRNAGWLSGLPAALVTVSLSARHLDERRAGLQSVADGFYRKTGWTPAITHHVAGALRYRAVGWLRRWRMRRVATQRAADTDASRDHEYTDWDNLARFVDEFAAATSQQEGVHSAVEASSLQSASRDVAGTAGHPVRPVSTPVGSASTGARTSRVPDLDRVPRVRSARRTR
jgi:menaquinone-dependent protoporphyrinogen oxidase